MEERQFKPVDQDETAWLEATARLVAERRYGEVDHQQLSEFLSGMATRDKREVLHRLTNLLAHLLQWKCRPGEHSHSRRAAIAVQRQELGDLLESPSLLRYAGDMLIKAYERAARQAAFESGLPEVFFPGECPFSLEAILRQE
jgi:hypothetical protein